MSCASGMLNIAHLTNDLVQALVPPVFTFKVPLLSGCDIATFIIHAETFFRMLG